MKAKTVITVSFNIRQRAIAVGLSATISRRKPDTLVFRRSTKSAARLASLFFSRKFCRKKPPLHQIFAVKPKKACRLFRNLAKKLDEIVLPSGALFNAIGWKGAPVDKNNFIEFSLPNARLAHLDVILDGSSVMVDDKSVFALLRRVKVLVVDLVASVLFQESFIGGTGEAAFFVEQRQ